MRNPFARRKDQAAPSPAAAEVAPDEGRAAFEAGLTPASIEDAAEMLIAGGATKALFVSPDGDEGAAVAVLVAREVSDAGLRVVILDLTVSGAVSRATLESVNHVGVTDLLVSEAGFTEAVHVDHYSDCDILPVGTADPVRAMQASARLPVIVRSLTSAYDLVVVECGATDADGIRALLAEGTEMLVSAVEMDDRTVATAAQLRDLEHGRVTVVSLPDGEIPLSASRSDGTVETSAKSARGQSSSSASAAASAT
jgi:Mrp family chromosome partitioning ATPase